jgi:hypothetical protein
VRLRSFGLSAGVSNAKKIIPIEPVKRNGEPFIREVRNTMQDVIEFSSGKKPT